MGCDVFMVHDNGALSTRRDIDMTPQKQRRTVSKQHPLAVILTRTALPVIQVRFFSSDVSFNNKHPRVWIILEECFFIFREMRLYKHLLDNDMLFFCFPA